MTKTVKNFRKYHNYKFEIKDFLITNIARKQLSKTEKNWANQNHQVMEQNGIYEYDKNMKIIPVSSTHTQKERK